MQKAKVVNGIYCGVKGKATKPTSLGLVMFYPHKSKPCARFWARERHQVSYLTFDSKFDIIYIENKKKERLTNLNHTTGNEPPKRQ